MRVTIRGWADGKLAFVERHKLDASGAGLDATIATTAKLHARKLRNSERQMIEIEFEDEPDQNKRFFRFGTDPRGMVAPIAIRKGARN